MRKKGLMKVPKVVADDPDLRVAWEAADEEGDASGCLAVAEALAAQGDLANARRIVRKLPAEQRVQGFCGIYACRKAMEDSAAARKRYGN